MRRVGVIGYGYVGKAMCRLFERRFDVTIYDIASHPDPSKIVGCEFILICVPTPARGDGMCDITAVQSAAKTALTANPNALVCIKSAVPPGMTDMLNAAHQTSVFHVSPEYMGEGKNPVPPWEYPDPVDATFHDFVIVGGPRASEVLTWFQAVMPLTARYVSCRAREAELCKRMENAFFSAKVAFVNEMYDIAQAMGVDWHTLRELWLMDPRIGRSHTAVFPDDRGFGGKCLPKDLSALITEADRAGVDAEMLKSVRGVNEKWRRR